MEFIRINALTQEHAVYSNRKIAEFLVRHLEEYGDKIEDIQKCMDFVMTPEKGGDILAGVEHGTIVGAVIINHTGMKDYIPENILVYVAVACDQGGKGVGSKLMKRALSITNGSVALHVEPGNPALKLYEKLGFSNKYLEMRLMR